jgi:hypothetical protein
MAEAWLNRICNDYFAAESAGLEPDTLNPLVVEAMGEKRHHFGGARLGGLRFDAPAARVQISRSSARRSSELPVQIPTRKLLN